VEQALTASDLKERILEIIKTAEGYDGITFTVFFDELNTTSCLGSVERRGFLLPLFRHVV